MQISIIAFVAGLILTLIVGKLLLPMLRRLKIGQTIRNDGPQSHLIKAGTPTMGGLMFVISMLIVLLVLGNGSKSLWIWLFSFIAFGAIGFYDDMLKVVFHRSLGLTVKQKLVGQYAAAIILLVAAQLFLGRGTAVIIPFVNYSWDLGWFYYIVMATFFVGIVNGTNFTDGLDGLAAGVSAIVFIGYWLIMLVCVSYPTLVMADYHDLAVAAASLAGCLIGFLFYNQHPAKVFMGDTGSLAIGGAVVGFALLSKTEIVLIIIGGVYLVEILSVMLQVASFKLWGKRILLMSPLHHHFELKGWPEVKVVRMFWLASAILTALGLLIVSI